MSAVPKKKLCWQCDGRVDMQEENCPFCGVYLSPVFSGQDEGKHTLTPPYRLVTTEEETIPKAPYAPSEEVTKEEESPLSIESSSVRQTILTMALLFAGSILLFFGSLLMIFSENGFLTLRWNGEYWYLYLILAMPLLFFGWRGLNQISETV